MAKTVNPPLDVAAGGGYTSQLLALAVAPDGKVWAQRMDLVPRSPSGSPTRRRRTSFPCTGLSTIRCRRTRRSSTSLTLVLNYHDITYLPVDRARMNQSLFAALKPGGHFVVVDHSGRPGTGIAEGKTLHRIDEAVVRDEIARAGFVLEAEGSFLRNPADPRDQSSGEPKVPTDKFALRFVKPR